MTSTAADYVWFEKSFPELAEAYCFTLVHGLPPSEVLRRLQGREESSRTGAEQIVEAAFDLLRSDDTRQLIAMTSVGDWTLLIEPNGYLGVTEEKALPASAGTSWISHFVNINGLDSFLWVEDGTKRLTFEPLFPDSRWGTTPDELLEAMRRIGFQFGEETSDTEEIVSDAAAFALAEHLSGVRITPEPSERRPSSAAARRSGELVVACVPDEEQTSTAWTIMNRCCHVAAGRHLLETRMPGIA